jgi:hypothetical protein
MGTPATLGDNTRETGGVWLTGVRLGGRATLEEHEIMRHASVGVNVDPEPIPLERGAVGWFTTWVNSKSGSKLAETAYRELRRRGVRVERVDDRPRPRRRRDGR